MTLARIDGHLGSLMEQAEVLSRSNLVPKAFRGKPGDVVVAMLLGQELGLGPMATMSMVDVIEGNATLNAEGKVSLVRKAGHSISGEAQATKAYARGKRSDTGDEMIVEWTIQMAARASLANKEVWKQYPEAMLWSRAVSQLCRMLFPDVLAGLSYTPEEVEAFSGIESTSPDRAAALPAVPALPPADPDTGELHATTRRRPPPGSTWVPCPVTTCDRTARTKADHVPHLIDDHGWERHDGKLRSPSSDASSTGTQAPPAAPNDDEHDSSADVGSSTTTVPPVVEAGGGEAQGAPVAPPPALSRTKRTTALMAAATKRYPDRQARIDWAADTLGRHLTTFAALTPADESVLLNALAEGAEQAT